MRRLGSASQGPGSVYMVGGSSAVLIGWRSTTVDVDLKLDPEPPGAFDAIARAKDALNVNVELAAPDDFIPALPSWRDRSPFIVREGPVDFFHYDFYGQALAKIERGHAQDLEDVTAMHRRGLVRPAELSALFDRIEGDLVRYPAIDPPSFREKVARMVATLATLAATLILSACDSSAPSEPPPLEPPSTPFAPIAVPPVGTDTTFDVATWNLLYFGSGSAGPIDEPLQRARVRDVILGADADLWAVQEVVGTAAFLGLLDELPEYDGLLANDPGVVEGAAYYDPGEQKVGLVYKRGVVEFVGARVVLGELNWEFAGRPPLEARLRVSVGGGTVQDMVVLVLHAKASTDADSWERRLAASEGLHEYLDAIWPNHPLLVPGDWNDDLDESITAGRDTPYRNFLDAAPEWVFPTATLGAGGTTSILGFDDVIDHILVSDDAMAWYQAGSALVYRVDEHVPQYRWTTSDHLPVLARFKLPG